MDTRREFLKKVAALSASAAITGSIPESIARAASIDPAIGSTFMDAEHIVVLMQENRSFDHSYGTLQGVRGFNDPRAIKLPNKNMVWLQTNAEGQTYLPFRLNIKETKSTWMGSLPHSWADQVDAGNHGKHDQWLLAKRPGNTEYQSMPLTLGYHTREDLPFYYSLADAFTVCDQNFCSSLTGTTPNRLYLWTGTIREKPDTSSYANVRNENVDYDKLAHWKTFPERLEENAISWKIYQNELSVGVGFNDDEDGWLGNFTDNPIEWFARYHVKFSQAYRDALPERIKKLKVEISKLEAGTKNETDIKNLNRCKEELVICEADIKAFTQENFNKLSAFERNLHEKAFVTNKGDLSYHKLVAMKYNDGNEAREVLVPAGDTLHQFRQDVRNKKLPMVSWLVAPANFSDHPGAPWYGAWYVSEVMDILTKDPETWKKTIFILAYDENDGYFDHVPPFRVPDIRQKHSGMVSQGIDASVEFVTIEQDHAKKELKQCRDSSIGLGYRVPLVVASPWSRGGAVCSQVFDHTSVLQFMEKFLSHKTGKPIVESNISIWRRTICGDLTSTFKPYNGEKTTFPIVLQQKEFIEGVHRAQFKALPSGYRALTVAEVTQVNEHPLSHDFFPNQEKGVRASCPLPYELYVEGHVDPVKGILEMSLSAGNQLFGKESAGAPFNVYATESYKDSSMTSFEASKNWAYAVKAGDTLTDRFELKSFVGGKYVLKAYGPNGFVRELGGTALDPELTISCAYEQDKRNKFTGNIELNISNRSLAAYDIKILDESYDAIPILKKVNANQSTVIALDLSRSHRWYDFSISVEGHSDFTRRYCGRVENGEAGFTDPLIGASPS